MNKDLVVGIDSSTSATKAIAWSAEGAQIAQGRAPIALANPAPGYFEQDPAEWWGSTAAALRTLTASVDPARIAGVAISNQRETFSIFTEDGEALRPGMVWLDDRARAQERRFGAAFGAERVHAISGKPLDVIPCLYRIIWLKENEPELFARAARIAEVHGYLCFRLTGRWATSTASADPTGMLDMRRLDWSDDILAAAGIPLDRLLPVISPGALIGEVTDGAAAATGLLSGTPVFAGGGDGQCAGTGVAALQRGRAYINLGTALVSGTYSPDYAYDPAFRTEIAIADSGYIFETCVRSGTFLLDWLAREMFGMDPAQQAETHASLEAQAAASPIGAGGVLLLPYWQGCMTPHWDSGARGVVAGLSGSTKKGDIYRAVLEGLALDQAHAATRAAAVTGTPVDHYVAMGGGAASDLWMQILADATACPVRRSTANEASSLGAAMAAAKGAGWFPSLAEASTAMASATVRTFEPDGQRASAYAELRDIYTDLWPALSSWNRRLSEFTERRAGQS
jgi:sugar (pentulose or hexulose) kinase